MDEMKERFKSLASKPIKKVRRDGARPHDDEEGEVEGRCV